MEILNSAVSSHLEEGNRYAKRKSVQVMSFQRGIGRRGVDSQLCQNTIDSSLRRGIREWVAGSAHQRIIWHAAV
jgi:hypothetical protein